MRMIIGMGKGSTNESICSRNSLLPFQGLPTSLKITASLHVMGFCIILASSLPMKLQKKTKKKRKKDNKYNYEIDFSSALKTARKFFVRRDSHKHVDIIKLMMKYVHAVKIEFRQFDRPLLGIGAIHFGYR